MRMWKKKKKSHGFNLYRQRCKIKTGTEEIKMTGINMKNTNIIKYLKLLWLNAAKVI